MKFLSLAYGIVVTLFATLSPTTSQAASFSRELITAHPCLEQVSLPSNISPAKPADIPEAYRDWANPGVWAGYWGGSLCHVIVIKKISPEGIVDFLYATGKPFFEHGEYVGIITEVYGVQQLKFSLAYQGVKAQYSLNKHDAAVPFFLLEGMWQAPSSSSPTIGTFKQVKWE